MVGSVGFATPRRSGADSKSHLLQYRAQRAQQTARYITHTTIQPKRSYSLSSRFATTSPVQTHPTVHPQRNATTEPHQTDPTEQQTCTPHKLPTTEQPSCLSFKHPQSSHRLLRERLRQGRTSASPKGAMLAAPRRRLISLPSRLNRRTQPPGGMPGFDSFCLDVLLRSYWRWVMR